MDEKQCNGAESWSIDTENENKLSVFNKGERIELLSMKWMIQSLLPAVCITSDSKKDGKCSLIEYTNMPGPGRAPEGQRAAREERSGWGWTTGSEGTDECETDVADADILSPFLQLSGYPCLDEQ